MYLVKPFTLYMNVIVHRMRLYGEDDSNALLKTDNSSFRPSGHNLSAQNLFTFQHKWLLV